MEKIDLYISCSIHNDLSRALINDLEKEMTKRKIKNVNVYIRESLGDGSIDPKAELADFTFVLLDQDIIDDEETLLELEIFEEEFTGVFGILIEDAILNEGNSQTFRKFEELTEGILNEVSYETMTKSERKELMITVVDVVESVLKNFEMLFKEMDEFLNEEEWMEFDDDLSDQDVLIEEIFSMLMNSNLMLVSQAIELLESEQIVIDELLEFAHQEENDYLKLGKYNAIISTALYLLLEEHKIDIYSEENLGMGWAIHETRPLIFAKNYHMEQLASLGYMMEAINAGLDILLLNESDNLGVRYTLLTFFLIVGDIKGIDMLREKFDESGFMWDFPYVVSLFEEGRLKESKKIMEDLFEDYPFAYDILVYDKQPSEEDLSNMSIGYISRDASEVYTRLSDMHNVIKKEFIDWIEKEFKSNLKH